MVERKRPKSDATKNQEQWRLSNTGRLLFNAARRFEDRVIRYVNTNGFPDIRVAHIAVPRNLDINGTRITELAKRCVMTKQSMSDLVVDSTFSSSSQSPKRSGREVFRSVGGASHVAHAGAYHVTMTTVTRAAHG